MRDKTPYKTHWTAIIIQKCVIWCAPIYASKMFFFKFPLAKTRNSKALGFFQATMIGVAFIHAYALVIMFDDMTSDSIENRRDDG